MSSINALLAKSIIAYRQGLNKPVPLLDETGVFPVEKLTGEYINSSAPLEDQRVYNTVMHLINLADNLRTQNLPEASKDILHKAQMELERSKITPLTHLLCYAYIKNSEAELLFRLKEYAKTRACIMESINMVQVLEQDYSLSFLHVLRLRQILLYIRVLSNTGEAGHAIKLCNEAIFYLLGYGSDIRFSEGWSQNLVKLIDEPSRRALVAQYVSEVGMILARLPEKKVEVFFTDFHSWKCFSTQEPVEIYNWGEMKNAYIKGEYAAFLSLCADFLRDGRKETLLWDVAVIDLCRCCNLLNPEKTSEFLREVSENSKNMYDIPPGGYSLPTQTYYKRIFVVKGYSYPAFVLPAGLRELLLSVDPDSISSRVAEELIKGKTGSSLRLIHTNLTERRFHAYNVGLPRSGCSSIMALFSNYRSVAEYKERESVEIITAWKDGWINENTLEEYIQFRHEVGLLEMDTASFNHFYLHILIKKYPEAKFIFTIRDCYSWVNSFLRMISRWKKHFLDIGQDMPDWMLNYGRILFGEYDWSWFNSYDDLHRNLEPLVEMFVNSWVRLNSRILELLPPERSLIIKTSEISLSQERLADFIGIPQNTLTGHHHINKAPDEVNLLQNYSHEKFEALYNQVTKHAPILRLFDSREFLTF